MILRCRAATLAFVVGVMASACTAKAPEADPSGRTSAAIATDAGGDNPLQATTASADSLEAARREVAALPLDRLAAQVIVARYDGTTPQAAERAIAQRHLGGVILFASNLPTDGSQLASTVSAAARAAQEAMSRDGRAWPAMVAVDQEGGVVARIGEPATSFGSAMQLGAAADPELTRRVARASGVELRSLGVNTVLSPVADVTAGPDDPAIGSRSPGSDPEAVARVVAAEVGGYREAGILSAAKHFPGHGAVTVDSHVELPVQPASKADLQRRDWVPFGAAVHAGVPLVLLGHLRTPSMDPSLPATLSPPTVAALRHELGFRGLVITDSMEMGAITKTYGAGRAAVMALAAGADVVLLPADVPAAIRAITDAVASGELPKDRLLDAAAQMVATLRTAAPAPSGELRVGENASLARELAAKATTQLSGVCGTDLLNGSVSVTGGNANDRVRFAEAATARGLTVGAGTHVALIGGPAYQAAGDTSFGPRPAQADIVVALDVPYVLAGSSATRAHLATYGRTRQSYEALLDVLTGRAKASGKLPVVVGRWPIGSGCP